MPKIWILLSFVIEIQVYKAPIKKEPDFFSENIKVVSYGEKLNADTLQGTWYRVKYQGETGYIHKSAVRRFRKINVSGVLSKTKEQPNEDAISLAAKGFINDNKNKNSGYDFKDVEYLNKFNLQDEDIKRFKEGGGL